MASIIRRLPASSHAGLAVSVWLALQALLAALWPLGSGSPFGGRTDLALVVVSASVGGAVLCAATARSRRLPRLLPIAAGWAACALLCLVVPGNLVMRLVFGLTSDPALGQQVFAMVGGVLCGAAAEEHRRRTTPGCGTCGRGRTAIGRPDGTVVAPGWMRAATYAAAIVPLLGFTLPHWSWMLGIPLGTTESGAISAGIPFSLFLLGALPAAGAVLTLGLARPWGQRFPRWVPILADRRVPRGFAFAPPLAVGALVGQYGAMMTGCLAFGMTRRCDPQGSAAAALDGQWAFAATYPVFLVWGLALLIAALGYWAMTRPPCASCRVR